ncbi:hypothetical protein H2200_011823 [Cladophialophora chaetospira]|uniref:Major facilitator superfamily (MFS) profile domain-containing protein n=1 Tax=Cladophialophora chaetospira TaxID=386627 RepID=A0AA39CCX8_9EURO|nr:hypothetical protein H2200_011823 [Cladophialophora chaetospira]
MNQATSTIDPKSLVAHNEHETMEKGHLDPPEGIGKTAHLYQEDSEGRVLAKLLLPRPTSDPKDPLIWSRWRKLLAFISVSYFIFLSNFITSSCSPILIFIMRDFDVTITQASYLITVNILFLGVGNFFWVPLSLKIGKRPVFVASTIVFFVSSVWAMEVRSFGSLLGARIIQGFGASACEALGPAVVADLFFLHERGFWCGFCMFMLALGSSLGGVLGGLVADGTGDWRWVFRMNAILTGVAVLLTILVQSETNFKRPTEHESGDGMPVEEVRALRSQVQSSWVKSLGFTAWYDREASIWKLWLRPFLTLRYPSVLWGSLVMGVSLGWLVLQLTANAGAFPIIYNYSAKGVGNIAISYIVTAVIGCFVGGPLSDWISAWFAKRRGGYFIPEYRLWSIVPVAVFAPIGLLMWGGGLQSALDPFVAIVGTAITHGIICAVSSFTIAYVVDCNRPIAGETVTALTAVKNTFAFGFSFAVFPWLNLNGYLQVSGWMTLIEGVLFLLAIPMYIYGPRFRQWQEKDVF